MTKGEREQSRRELIEEITRAVRKEFPTLIAAAMKALREELRHELQVCGLVYQPWHVRDEEECLALAMRLRATADLLDPPPQEQVDWLADPKREDAQ